MSGSEEINGWMYGIPHVTTLYNTRHEAIGVAANLGRGHPKGALYWTKRVEAFHPARD